MKREIYAIVFGQIQGVGFRYAVKNHALLHQIKGYTRNLPDGSVEICAQGTEESLKKFLAALQELPGRGHVERIDTIWRIPGESYSAFEIIH